MSVVLTAHLASSARHHDVVARELAGSRLTRRGTDSEPRQAFSSMRLHELIEAKHLLLELESRGSRSCSDPT